MRIAPLTWVAAEAPTSRLMISRANSAAVPGPWEVTVAKEQVTLENEETLSREKPTNVSIHHDAVLHTRLVA